MNDKTIPPWFDRRLSVGNLITIGIVLAGAMAGWFQFENRLSAAEKDINTNHMLANAEALRLSARLAAIEAERQDVTSRLIRVEEKISAQNETLARILRNVERDGRRDRP